MGTISGMRDVCCSQCGTHLGWMNDCGPCGSFYCDACKEAEEQEEPEEKECIQCGSKPGESCRRDSREPSCYMEREW